MSGFNISSLGNSYASQATTGLDLESKKTEGFADLLKSAEKAADDKQLMDACQEFETYFINSMFKNMRQSINTSEGFIPKSFAEETFQDMLDEEYAKNASQQGSFGLAKFMFEQMSRSNAAQQTQQQLIDAGVVSPKPLATEE